jgi:predicted negative regulator of RcsB-dependent stress response
MKLNITKIRERAGQILEKLHRYAVPLFMLFLLAVYGFLSWRIYTLNQVAADESAVTKQLKTAGVPKINEDVLKKIEQLQDNSVEVQTLFDQARSNPFQE